MGAERPSPAGGSDLGSPSDQELTAAAELRITLIAAGRIDAAPAGSSDSAR
jgi:hypothetical protein